MVGIMALGHSLSTLYTNFATRVSSFDTTGS
jgi:hypothetical protein